jgi:hypothetical protein
MRPLVFTVLRPFTEGPPPVFAEAWVDAPPRAPTALDAGDLTGCATPGCAGSTFTEDRLCARCRHKEKP